MKRKIFTLLLALFSVIAIQAQVRYVTEKGSGTKDGSSWENASKDIQEMIDELYEEGGGEVWVKAGVYVPTKKVAEFDETGIDPTTNRDKAFRLRKNVQIYGGFKGTETSLDSRDWKGNSTILSGAINQVDYAYHVVLAIGDVGSALLDGFTVTNGRAYKSDSDPNGSQARVVVDDVPLYRSAGAGIVIQSSSPGLNNLTISNNISNHTGGCVIHNSSSKFTNSVIENNATLVQGNGGLYFIAEDGTELSNLIIRNNTSAASTGGLSLKGSTNNSSIKLNNITLENNEAKGSIGGGAITACKLEATNIIVRNNKSTIDGGGLRLNDLIDSSITGLVLSNNTASSGGGLYISNSIVALDDITAIGNIVSTNGGGIAVVSESSVSINRLLLLRNEATSNGGGVFIKNNSVVSIENSLISKNQSKRGSAVNLHGGEFVGTNLLITENISSVYACIEVSNNDIRVSLTNSSILKNIAEGGFGGIKTNDNTNLKNCLIWGNANNIGNVLNTVATTSSAIYNCLVEGYDLSVSNNNLDGTDGVAYTNANMFVDYDNADYHLKPGSPVIGLGEDSYNTTTKDLDGLSRFEDNIDLGAYEYQSVQTPVFEGGYLKESARSFTYSGNPIDLRLINIPEGSTVSYAWEGTDNTDSGTGMTITEAGKYRVTATVGTDTYTTDVLVEKKKVFIQLDDVEMMECILGGTPETKSLNASYDASQYAGAALSHTYTSSNENVAYLDVSGTSIVSGISGHSIIRTTTTGDADFIRNYEVIEAFAVATVLPLTIDGSVTPNVDETEFDEEVIIRGGVTFEDDVIFHEEVTIEGEPTNFNGGAIFEEDAVISGEVNFNNPDKEVIFEKEVSFVDPNAKTTFESDVIFHDDVDFAGDVEFKGDATFKGEAEFDGEAIFNNEGSEAIFEKEATFNDKTVFEGDVTFQDEVAFNGESEFNGSATFENGANFTNEVPVFNGDVTITGDITLPTGETLTIDNDGNTITIVGEGCFSESVIINGGTLVLGELTVDGDLDLNGVTVKVTPGTSLNADKINGTPKSLIDLSEMPVGKNNGLTVGVFANGVTPDDLFDVNANSNISYSWTDNGNGSYTLEVTRAADPVLYTVSYSAEWGSLEVSHDGISITSGSSVDAGVSLSISATTDVAGMVLKSLTVNGVEVDNNSSITITGDTDIVAVFELEGTDPNPDPTGNAEIAEGDISVTIDNGQLTVDNERGKVIDVTIYNLRGQVMVQRKVEATATFTLPTGFYLVKTAEKTVKIAVK